MQTQAAPRKGGNRSQESIPLPTAIDPVVALDAAASIEAVKAVEVTKKVIKKCPPLFRSTHQGDLLTTEMNMVTPFWSSILVAKQFLPLRKSLLENRKANPSPNFGWK